MQKSIVFDEPTNVKNRVGIKSYAEPVPPVRHIPVPRSVHFVTPIGVGAGAGAGGHDGHPPQSQPKRPVNKSQLIPTI